MQRTFDVVMLAEDRQHHADLARYLDQQGYGVRILSTGRELLALMDQQPVDLLLLSASHTDADTVDILARIRGNPDWEHIGITMLSSPETLPQVLEALHRGADDFLIEPYNTAVMDARISAIASRKQRRSVEQARLRKIEHVAEKMEHIALRLGIELADETDFDKLVQKIVSEAMSVCNADGGAFYIRTNEDGSNGVSDDDAVRLVTYVLSSGAVQTGSELPSLALFDKHTGAPNVGLPMTCAATSAQIVNSADIDQAKGLDYGFVKSLDALSGYRTVSCLTVPILRDSSGYVMGVLELFNALDEDKQPTEFDAETVLMAQALAAQAAVAINNHMLIKQHSLLAKLENDINIGRGIQQSFLPSVMPVVPGMQIAARFRPAREVAGDFYDVFHMMNNRKLGFFIADVTDKGVGAALFMSLTRSLLRAFATQNRNINWAETLFGDEGGGSVGRNARASGNSRLAINANALKTAVVSTNDYITEFHLDLNMFATLFFGMIDPNTGSLFYINGGHCPPYLLDKDGNIKERLESTGPAVGMFPGAEFEIQETQLEHGDTLFMYTDGCTDVRNPTGKFFTEHGLTSLVSLPAKSPKELLDRVDNTLQNFMRDAAQFDDITMLALSRE